LLETKQFSIRPNMEWYPLVNVYIANWKDPPCWMCKFTISTGPFSIANCNKLPQGTCAWAFWKKQHVLEHLQWVSAIGDLDIIMICSWNNDVQMPIFYSQSYLFIQYGLC
jgi:hypothetical protein